MATQTDDTDRSGNSNESNNFFSTSRFINFIKDKYKNKFIRAVCYFEGDNAFKNKFNKVCCKPLFITLEETNKRNNIYLNYNKINSLFGDSIIISFNNKFELNSKSSLNKMYLLVIEFEQKTYLGTQYYPSHITVCENKHNIEHIRDQFKVEFDNSNIDDNLFI